MNRVLYPLHRCCHLDGADHRTIGVDQRLIIYIVIHFRDVAILKEQRFSRLDLLVDLRFQTCTVDTTSLRFRQRCDQTHIPVQERHLESRLLLQSVDQLRITGDCYATFSHLAALISGVITFIQIGVGLVHADAYNLQCFLNLFLDACFQSSGAHGRHQCTHNDHRQKAQRQYLFGDCKKWLFLPFYFRFLVLCLLHTYHICLSVKDFVTFGSSRKRLSIFLGKIIVSFSIW